jgi:hypothetical protein
LKAVSPSGQDEATAMVTRPAASPGRGVNVVVADIGVVDDLSDVVPVTTSELAAVETFLGNLFDHPFADAEALGNTAKIIGSSNCGKALKAPRPRP